MVLGLVFGRGLFRSEVLQGGFVALTPFEQVLLAAAGFTGCVNTFLQVLRSRARQREAQERRAEIAESRALAIWLYDHGKREEEAHEELVEAVRSVTPISVPKLKE